MNGVGIGWLAAIIIGDIAGWIASGLIKTDTGVFLNIASASPSAAGSAT